MGQSSSKHHPISAYEAAQMNDLLNYTEPSENEQPRKIRQNDAEFEKSRNVIEVNKAVDFHSGHELIKIATKDDLSNLTTNPLLYLNGNIISSSHPISHIEPPTLSNLPLEMSGRDTDNVIRGMRKIVTHTQMASPLIDDVLEQQANFVYKRFSFANQKAQFNLQESRLSRKLSGMETNLDPNMDSQTGKRTSKWLTRSGEEENQSLQMREEVEKLKEYLEKSGQLSNKKNRASNINESGDASRLNDKSLNSQIAEEGGHGVAKVLPGKHGILEEEKKNFTKKNTVPKGATKPVSGSISRTQTKSKGPTDKGPNSSRKASKSFAKEKEHEHAKCIRVANKEKIPVVYKDIQSSSTPRNVSGTKPVPKTNVNKKPANKVVSKVATSATAAKKKDYIPRKPSISRSYSNLRKVDLNKSYRTQGDNSFEEHSHLNQSARTTPMNNVSLYQETELNPINVDLDLKDLLQQSNLVSPYQNFSGGNMENQMYMGNPNNEYLPQQYVMHDNYHDNYYDQENPGWNPQMQGYEDYDPRGQERMYNYEIQGPYAQYSYPNQSQHYLPNNQYSGRENVFIQNQENLRDPGFEENNHIMFHNGSPQKDRRMYYA